MREDNTERIRARILSLIDTEFESDAAFERALGLRDKTVNNWRRDRSASYMKMIPELAEKFGVNVTELLDTPLSGDASELSDEEMHLVRLYRKSRTLPAPMRAALVKTLEAMPTDSELIIAFDADKAGRENSIGLSEALEEISVEHKIIDMDNMMFSHGWVDRGEPCNPCNDVNDVLSRFGVEAMVSFITSAPEMVTYP